MNDLNGLITSLRPNTDDAYQRRRETDLARAFATRRRRGFSLRLRLVAVAAPVALAGIVAAVALAPRAAPSPDHSAATDHDVRASSLQQFALMSAKELGIRVFLCKHDDIEAACGGSTGNRNTPAGGGTAATEQQKADIDRMLNELPGVESVTFEDQAGALARFRAFAPHMTGVEAKDMHASFLVIMEPDADYSPVLASAKSMPGVSNAFKRVPVPQTPPLSTSPPAE
ncbi:permease-like cell division protein FtsX [Nonomuraea sp. NPDC049725]|uniref:permease-like cell division protein FtsX n=1 Tax=Nonomuraea sp. NPDC049725 TaxID=3154508 RepID=UPI003440D36F